VTRHTLVMLSITAWLALAGCETAPGTMRDGQAVIETTGEAIAADPRAWDGKWVRVQGVISVNGHALYTPASAATDGFPLGWDDGSLLLDPAKRADDENAFEDPASETQATVIGRVRSVCADFWKPILAKMEADAARGDVYTYHPAPPEGFPFCAIVSGPYIEHAVIQPLVRNVP